MYWEMLSKQWQTELLVITQSFVTKDIIIIKWYLDGSNCSEMWMTALDIVSFVNSMMNYHLSNVYNCFIYIWGHCWYCVCYENQMFNTVQQLRLQIVDYVDSVATQFIPFASIIIETRNHAGILIVYVCTYVIKSHTQVNYKKDWVVQFPLSINFTSFQTLSTSSSLALAAAWTVIILVTELVVSALVSAESPDTLLSAAAVIIPPTLAPRAVRVGQDHQAFLLSPVGGAYHSVWPLWDSVGWHINGILRPSWSSAESVGAKHWEEP